jgi:sporulation protein YlmC with PRC-barrel domain
MILSDLLGSTVTDHDGGRLGKVVDARFAQGGSHPPLPGALAEARLEGFIVSPHSGTSFMGFERSRLTAPWPLAQLLRWRHRGAFLVAWEDVERIGQRRMVLRPGFRRHSPMLP